MGQDYTAYIAEKFLRDYRFTPVEKRLAFDAWADRMGFRPDEKRRLWKEVKSLSRRQGTPQQVGAPRIPTAAAGSRHHAE